jgi:uncharacterized membrane protein
MHNYPEAVLRIIDDYVDRVKSRLGPLPREEQDEFLREIRSHLYEAYQQAQEEQDAADGVARILGVIRRFGEPSEVVADRLPETMVRSGAKRSLPMRVIGGILIALFGIPLGFGGVGVMLGIVAAIGALVVAYYAAAGGILLGAASMLIFGLTRVYQPELFNRLIIAGIIQIDPPVRDLFEQFSAADQGYILILFGTIFAACGIGMVWFGRYVLRGVRFLFTLIFDQLRRGAQSLRRKAPAFQRPEFLANRDRHGTEQPNFSSSR